MFCDNLHFFHNPGRCETLAKHISARWSWVPDNTGLHAVTGEPFLFGAVCCCIIAHSHRSKCVSRETWIRATCLILTVNTAFMHNDLSDVDFFLFIEKKPSSHAVIIFSLQNNLFSTKILFPFIHTLPTLMVYIILQWKKPLTKFLFNPCRSLSLKNLMGNE